MAVAALVLSVMSFFMLGPLASLPGILVSALELRAIRRGESSPGGLTMTRVSLWVCIANVAIWMFLCAGMAIFYARMIAAMEGMGPPP